MTVLGQDQSSECFGRMTGLSALLPTDLVQVNVCTGSKCDLRHRVAQRPECDGEPTLSPERRLSANNIVDRVNLGLDR